MSSNNLFGSNNFLHPSLYSDTSNLYNPYQYCQPNMKIPFGAFIKPDPYQYGYTNSLPNPSLHRPSQELYMTRQMEDPSVDSFLSGNDFDTLDSTSLILRQNGVESASDKIGL